MLPILWLLNPRMFCRESGFWTDLDEELHQVLNAMFIQPGDQIDDLPSERLMRVLFAFC